MSKISEILGYFDLKWTTIIGILVRAAILLTTYFIHMSAFYTAGLA